MPHPIFQTACGALLALVSALPITGGNGRTTMTASANAAHDAPTKLRVYVGCYTVGKDKGLFIYDFDMATGALTPAGVGPDTMSPSFLAIAPSKKYLYAVNEVDEYEGQKGGGVSAYAIDPETGGLTFINEQSAIGTGTCHISMDKAGRHVLIANYGSGSVAVLPVHADGSVGKATAFVQHSGTGPDKARQEGPHGHSITLDPANHFAIACDLGLDKLLVYRFDAQNGTLTPAATPFASIAPASGPRHLAFLPNGKMVYVINEMFSTVTALSYNAHEGTLHTLQTLSTLPPVYHGDNSGAEIQVSPNGRFLYASNRGLDTIAIYAIDPATGRMTYIDNEPTRGKTPRCFSIDPTGKYLIAANQDSNTLVVFKIDAATGKFHYTGSTVEVPKPVCVRMMVPAEQ